MRHGPITLVVGIALAGALVGCADGPNELGADHDEEDPAAQDVADDAEVSDDGGSDGIDPAAQRAAGAALLWDGDVADEGVQRKDSEPGTPGGCLTEVFAPAAGGGDVSYHAAWWEYPTGSTLRHYVTALPSSVSGSGDSGDTTDGAAMLEAIDCAGDALALEVDGVDAHDGRCLDESGETTCTVLLTDRDVLSVVQVTAERQRGAEEAAERLAVIAADALERV
ncbi:hypothetical protein [Haloechinothrix sp. LS1_15]|uniref:hypothetical protein n=1 Tax=Haloechinothrix sp. LS1_15 TaxID=2652248 RepID=UPI002946984A|nr:hypothetical protein [Haloechinothrix sp. LS1_15]MDV6013987.1 hypothetical protein [Haloechinothrix sp. LS1_15]